MNDPLIRKSLPADWIDLCVGEAHVVRDALTSTFPLDIFDIRQASLCCDYQPPTGYPPLVKLLRSLYWQRHVVVTAGAKQALMAAFYVAKQKGMTHVAMRAPYWSQMPAAVVAAGLKPWFSDEPVENAAYLLVSPNNPDGHVTSISEALKLQERCKRLGVPLIHDAAYHSPVYLPPGEPHVLSLADISVHSAAKSYGLSGLRAGYLVADDPEVEQMVCEYVEATTVGTSYLSQLLLHRIVEHEAQNLHHARYFVERAQSLLFMNKQVAERLDPDVLDASGVLSSTGMFGWFKVGPRFDADTARVAVAPGSAFGNAQYVRLNLGGNHTWLMEAVERFNKAKR